MDPMRVLIPVDFVWRYGGRTVYLIGSFTGWSDGLLMSQVEDCPTVFRVKWNLPPGPHQYKFVVDGQGRHDDTLPSIENEYGSVNTVFLNSPYIINPGVASGSSMDVDPQVSRDVGQISEVALPHVTPRISEEDLRVSRHRIAAYLSSHTAYELIPVSSKVVALDVNLPVKQAFHILYEQGISAAPLWNSSKGQFVGVLTASDFILILRELGNHGSNLTEEQLERHTISAWKEGKAYMNMQIDAHGTPFLRNLINAGPYDNLKDLALKILRNGVATVPLLHSSSEDPFPKLLYLASLSSILKCICRYFNNCASSLPILQLPICSFPVGTWVPRIDDPNRKALAVLKPTALLSSALEILVQAKVSSIPIVDDNDSLVDIYCRSDITALAKDNVYTRVNLNEMTIHQALQLGQESVSPYEQRSQRCQMCLRTDSLHKVMERLGTPGVRRLVVVEAGSKRVEGIISLTDIFNFLLA